MATVVTKTVGPGQDYETLAAAISGEGRDLVAADEIARFVCHAFQEAGAVTVGGFTTDADRYVLIEPADPHAGSFTTSAYRIRATGSSAGMIINIPNVHLVGIQIDFAVTHTSVRWGIDCGSQRGIVIDRCLIRGVEAAGDNHILIAMSASGDGQSNVVRNCILYGMNHSADARAFHTSSGSFPVYVYNNTVVDCGVGFNLAGGARVRNNIGSGNATDYSGLVHSSSSHNVSSDATAPGTDAITGATVTFEDAPNDAYLLDPGDTSGAIASGVDLSAVADWPFDHDILGATRTEWDRGAHEVSAATAATLEVTRHRWRNDDGSESTATWREDENAPTTVQVGETVRLRKQIQATGDVGETAADLRVRKEGTTDPWVPVE